MIRNATPMRSRFGQVIEDCMNMIKEVNNVELYFIKRSANMPARASSSPMCILNAFLTRGLFRLKSRIVF